MMYPQDQQLKQKSVDYLPYDYKLSGGGSDTTKSESDVSKPTRPLTAYHVYFQLEREFILQETQSTENVNIETVKDIRPVGIELDPEMPLRYHNVHLCNEWYTTGKEKRLKRKHRKTHGKIAFLDLSKTIASRWATLEETDPETKNYCNRIAKRELDAYKEKVKVYKASIADDPISGLSSSFTSSTNEFLSAPSSPTLGFSPFSSQASLSIASPSSNRAASFQVCPDFHPEWMDKDTITTMACTDGHEKSRANSDPLSEWCPESLSVQFGKQEDMPVHSTPWERNSTPVTMTNGNMDECKMGTSNGARPLSKSMSPEPVENEFSFHPVPCDSEDYFLRKYRKLARRTSLFSIRPLHHQVAPLSQSVNGEATKSNNGFDDMMEYENLTNEPKRHRGFDCIQRKLRSELDKRVYRAIKRNDRVQPATFQPTHDNTSDAYIIKSGKKRLSSTVSESNDTRI